MKPRRPTTAELNLPPLCEPRPLQAPTELLQRIEMMWRMFYSDPWHDQHDWTEQHLSRRARKTGKARHHFDSVSGWKRQQKRRGAASRAELACLLFDFDRLMARARYDAGPTREELAEAVGLSSRHIGRIECGHGLPSLTAFARMHRVLGFDVNRALGCLLGRDVPRLPSGPFPGVLRAAERIARTPRSPVAFLGQAASGRLWRAGPLLSVSVHDDWQCQCDEQRQTASTLASFDTCGMPAKLCIGSLPVDIRLEDTTLQMSFLLLACDTGDEIEIRQPGLDGSLDTSNASPSAFMAVLYGLAVAECGMDLGRLGNVLRVIAFINRQCLAYVKNRGLTTPHG